MTQAERLVHEIRMIKRFSGQWPTYGELLAARISVCPWKRLEEAGHKYLRKNEVLTRGKDKAGRVVFVISRASSRVR